MTDTGVYLQEKDWQKTEELGYNETGMMIVLYFPACLCVASYWIIGRKVSYYFRLNNLGVSEVMFTPEMRHWTLHCG